MENQLSVVDFSASYVFGIAGGNEVLPLWKTWKTYGFPEKHDPKL